MIQIDGLYERIRRLSVLNYPKIKSCTPFSGRRGKKCDEIIFFIRAMLKENPFRRERLCTILLLALNGLQVKHEIENELENEVLLLLEDGFDFGDLLCVLNRFDLFFKTG